MTQYDETLRIIMKNVTLRILKVNMSVRIRTVSIMTIRIITLSILTQIMAIIMKRVKTTQRIRTQSLGTPTLKLFA